jgi:hypothetical protein
MDLLTSCIHHLELHFTDHWHTETSVLSLLQSLLAVSWQRLLPRESLQLPALRSSCHSRPCRTASRLGPRLAAISHQPPSLVFTGWLPTGNWQLNPPTHQPATSCLFTQLNCWQLSPTTNSLLQSALLITSRHEPHRKHRSIVSLVSVESLLRNGCLFIRLLHSNGTTCYNTLKHTWHLGRQMSHLSVQTKLKIFFEPALLHSKTSYNFWIFYWRINVLSFLIFK